MLQQIGRELPAHFRETIEEYFKRLAQDGVQVSRNRRARTRAWYESLAAGRATAAGRFVTRQLHR